MIRATHRSGLPDRKQHKGDPMRDAIIVGGGIAGMSAAWRLRHSDIIALEAGNRIGGRLRSERRGKYWLNWGGHVFGGEGSYADKLLKEVGVDALDLPGSFSALSFKGKTLNGGNVNLYPFKLPLSWGTRWEIVKAGLKVMKAVKAYGRRAYIRGDRQVNVSLSILSVNIGTQRIIEYGKQLDTRSML